jgi:hypothetical protein
MRVIEEEEICESEQAKANLGLRTATVITGQVRDETGAPFKNSEIRLRSVSVSSVQPEELQTRSDEEGRFRLDEAEPGSYRLLASPNRGFAQPGLLDCFENMQCKLEITLTANPTDQPYARCPIR